MRHISSGPTHGGGDYRAAYFGVGNQTMVDVVVHWPNGVVQDLGTMNANQMPHLIEPTTPPTMTGSVSLGDETVLTWDNPGSCDVEVYRSMSPYFAIADADLLATLTSGQTQYTDTGAYGSQIDYFYAIRLDCAGELSGKTNEVGVFHFDLVPDAP